jgi:hypothetical protein
LSLQRCGVLDDAVVHDGEPAGAVAMGMGVAVARLTIGRPTRVGDARRALEALRLQLIEFADAPFALRDLERALVADGDAGGIVAAILHPPQALQEDRSGLFPTYVSDDSTHGCVPRHGRML